MAMNKQELLAARKKAYTLWLTAPKQIRVSRLAEETGLTVEEIKHYRVKDKWAERKKKDEADGVLAKQAEKGLNSVAYKAEMEEEIDHMQIILDESGLRDQQKLFVMFYLQSHNAKLAALKAGYSKNSAGTRGNYQMRQPKVADTINKIKALMHENIYIRAHDIIDEYIKIAFADITDFIEFDNNRVALKSSDKVDGTIITEVKQGREGITLKMADKMKALERLEKLFEIIPDRRLELEEKKFALVEKQANLANQDGSNVTIINDIR